MPNYINYISGVKYEATRRIGQVVQSLQYQQTYLLATATHHRPQESRYDLGPIPISDTCGSEQKTGMSFQSDGVCA